MSSLLLNGIDASFNNHLYPLMQFLAAACSSYFGKSTATTEYFIKFKKNSFNLKFFF